MFFWRESGLGGGVQEESFDSLGGTRSLPMTTQHVILSELSEPKNLLWVWRSFQS